MWVVDVASHFSNSPLCISFPHCVAVSQKLEYIPITEERKNEKHIGSYIVLLLEQINKIRQKNKENHTTSGNVNALQV